MFVGGRYGLGYIWGCWGGGVGGEGCGIGGDEFVGEYFVRGDEYIGRSGGVLIWIGVKRGGCVGDVWVLGVEVGCGGLFIVFWVGDLVVV